MRAAAVWDGIHFNGRIGPPPGPPLYQLTTKFRDSRLWSPSFDRGHAPDIGTWNSARRLAPAGGKMTYRPDSGFRIGASQRNGSRVTFLVRALVAP